MKNEFETARGKYRPPEIKCLLVAESPPQKGSGRFFYFEDVKERGGPHPSDSYDDSYSVPKINLHYNKKGVQ